MRRSTFLVSIAVLFLLSIGWLEFSQAESQFNSYQTNEAMRKASDLAQQEREAYRTWNRAKNQCKFSDKSRCPEVAEQENTYRSLVQSHKTAREAVTQSRQEDNRIAKGFRDAIAADPGLRGCRDMNNPPVRCQPVMDYHQRFPHGR